MIEQRYVIKFFADESWTGIEIHQRLTDHHGDSAISQRHQGKGRTDVETISTQDGHQTKDFSR
jgi:hypothetical protein